jgi:hypothetical protein
MSHYDEDQEFHDEELENMTEVTTEPSDGIQITVDSRTLQTIADAAAQRLCRTLEDKVKKSVEEQLKAILDDAWRASVQAMAQAAIDAYLTAPRAKTNEWGESVNGKSTTLSSLIPETVHKWMGENVDEKGQRTDYNRGMTRLQWMLKSLVQDQLKAETTKAANDVTEKARALVSQHVGRFISEQMVPAISVDQGRAS